MGAEEASRRGPSGSNLWTDGASGRVPDGKGTALLTCSRSFRQTNREGVRSRWKKVSQSGKSTMLSEVRRWSHRFRLLPNFSRSAW